MSSNSTPQPRPVILCVDDERFVLHALRTQLEREFGGTLLVETAESGEEALEIVDDAQAQGQLIPVVIADQLMPGMKGHEFLTVLHQRQLGANHILLTGHADVESIGMAVNHANLYRFIAKPWEGTDLLLTVREALRAHAAHRLLQEQNQTIRRQNEELEQKVLERTQQLEEERQKSDMLLLSILPEETMLELKRTGKSLPRHYDMASILFTDFKDFSGRAAGLSPDALVADLNTCFTAFDEIADRHGMEKIKTIGDSYMCAGGIPVANATHAVDAVRAGLEMLRWLQSWAEERATQGLPAYAMRVGIHTGEVVAGVIGTRKFAYDLWGDAVNIASRMETAGEVGRVNVSDATWQLISSEFKGEYRGEIQIKNRGAMPMWFVLDGEAR